MLVSVLVISFYLSIIALDLAYADEANKVQFEDLLKIAKVKNAVDKKLTDSIETEARYKQLDLPENMLVNLTDRQLLKLVKIYPLLGVSFLYDSPEKAVKVLQEVYAPFRILMARASGKKLLLKEYAQTKSKGTADKIDVAYKFLLVKVYSYSKLVTFRTAYETIKTPKGTAVSVIQRGEELTNTDKDALNNYVAEKYPNARRVGEPTTNYNCHSYADGSYNSSPRENADIIKYGENEHTGIYLGRKKVKSKWGEAGLYIHGKNYSPYRGSRTYWKKI